MNTEDTKETSEALTRAMGDILKKDVQLKRSQEQVEILTKMVKEYNLLVTSMQGTIDSLTLGESV